MSERTHPDTWDFDLETRRGMLTDFAADPQATLEMISDAAAESDQPALAKDPYMVLVHCIVIELLKVSMAWYEDEPVRKFTGAALGGLLFDGSSDPEQEPSNDVVAMAKRQGRAVREAALAGR